MLDIYEMQIFLAAAETGSFSEAGRRLQMSQPAVSMQIRSLENRLNVELFHRSGRHIRLTEIGQNLIPMARQLINHSVQIEEAISSMQGEVVGVLRLACSTTSGKYVLPKLIAGFINLYPSVQVICRVGSRGSALKMLMDNEAQLGITSLREPSRELEYRPFITDPVILIAPPNHPWAKRQSIDIEDLPDGRFVRRETNSGTQQTVIEALSAHNLSANELPTVLILGNSEAIQIAVAEGIGVAFISKRAALDGIENKQVAEIQVKGLEMRQQLYMVRRANNVMTRSQTAFWDYVFTPENQSVVESILT